MIGLGASAIGSLPQGYAQNENAVPAYEAAIDAGRLPSARGIALSPDDRLRRDVIEQVMCQLRGGFGWHGGPAWRGPGRAAGRITAAGGIAGGWADRVGMGEQVTVTDAGRPFVRSVAALFDTYLGHSARAPRPGGVSLAVATLGVDAVIDSVQQAVRHARRSEYPFCHWQLHDILPGPRCVRAMSLLPAALIQGDNCGRRETHNASRRFLDPVLQAQSPACADVAAALQSAALVHSWHDLCGISLRGNFLRVEYCQDGGGFWLEPHTDIGAKLFTLLIYLVDPPAGEMLGHGSAAPGWHAGGAGHGGGQ